MPTPNQTALKMAQNGFVLDAGLGAAPSGYGADYDKLFQANPYRDLTYRQSAWQKLVSLLGFRTDYDRWKEDAQVNSAEYDAGIFSMMQQNQYNSPEAQASRMREAGMNPDLLGIGDVAGAATPAEDPNGMSQNVGDEFADFGTTIASVFSRAMTVFKDFKSIEQMNTIIDSQNIDNAVKMTGAIDSFLESSLTAEDMVDFDTYQERVLGLANSEYLNHYAETMGYSKRQRPSFARLAHDRLLSMSTDEKAFNLFKSRLEAMAGSKEAQTNPFTYGAVGAAAPSGESAVDIMVKGLSRAHKRALEFTAKRDAALSVVQAQEAQTLEDMNAGSASARAQYTEYNSKKAVAQWNAECARIKKDMIRDLERAALGGDWLAKAMLFSWSLDDIAKLNVGLNAGLNLSLGANFGANISNSVSTLFTP